ncbi:MAG: ATP-dependent 6-phosphofructokinase [Candidatus Omnitrophota bacterium]
METQFPCLEDLQDLNVPALGRARFESPLIGEKRNFVPEDSRVLVYSNTRDVAECRCRDEVPPSFEEAGPREKLYFDPRDVTAGIVTCGGLCPGLNDVIRTIVLSLFWQYGVKKVLGFWYGYEGVSSHARKEPLVFTPDHVDDIQHHGGTLLGTSRGPQDSKDMVDTLEKHDVDMLFVIGGDGTFSGAHELVEEIQGRERNIAVVGVPKTIDNDIYCSEQTFGFNTAVGEARQAIASAHNEAISAWNGIGLVKLMGRDSGFIAVHAALANSDINFCLIPEVDFELEGENGLLARLERRLERRRHAVIVTAEGAGQHLMEGEERTDPSGNRILKDIGFFLQQKIKDHFRGKETPITLKYIDPSYMIRSCAANAQDSTFCIMLGQKAVHAAMAGKTDIFVGYWNHHFVHVPFKVSAGKRKKIDPCGEYWQTVLSITD